VGGFEKVLGIPPDVVGFPADFLLFCFFLNVDLLSSVLKSYNSFLFGNGFFTSPLLPDFFYSPPLGFFTTLYFSFFIY
jgi:hypothetical protein